jgi:hypothetical protein
MQSNEEWLKTIAGNEPNWDAPSEDGESRRIMLANLDDIDFNAPERAHRLDYVVSIFIRFLVLLQISDEAQTHEGRPGSHVTLCLSRDKTRMAVLRCAKCRTVTMNTREKTVFVAS